MHNANDLVIEADKLLNKKSLIKLFQDKNQKYEDAIELYEKAVIKYKANKQFKEAGDVMKKCCDCHIKLNDTNAVCKSLVEATICYKKDPLCLKEAISCCEQVVLAYVEIGNFDMAAKYKKDVADMQYSQNDLLTAVESYELAINYAQSANYSKSLIDDCKKKIAVLVPYEKAATIYEELAITSVNEKLLSYSVSGFLLRAGLCRISLTI